MSDPTEDPKIRDEDRNFETTTPEANRSVEQGNGIGAKELAAQGDPTTAAEHDPFEANPEAREAQARSQG